MPRQFLLPQLPLPIRRFRKGGKELFLPNITITLLRTPALGPNFARFTVPLWFNKFDLRDYLYHAYGVEVNAVRSYVQLQPVTNGPQPPSHISSNLNTLMPTERTYIPRRWHRPKSIKMMTVELTKPFVWPEVPEDFKPWGKSTVEKYEAERDDVAEQRGDMGGKNLRGIPSKSKESLREQAKRLLEGKEKWSPGLHHQFGLSAMR